MRLAWSADHFAQVAFAMSRRRISDRCRNGSGPRDRRVRPVQRPVRSHPLRFASFDSFACCENPQMLVVTHITQSTGAASAAALNRVQGHKRKESFAVYRFRGRNE